MKVYGQCPYGYIIDPDGNLLPDKGELIVVNKIKVFRKKGLSLNKIAERLNTIHTPTKNGGKWEGESVRRILNNPLHHAPIGG